VVSVESRAIVAGQRLGQAVSCDRWHISVWHNGDRTAGESAVDADSRRVFW